MKNTNVIATKFERVADHLSERSRRLWAAAEAMALGHGGIAQVHLATGIVPSTISKGISELRGVEAGGQALDPSRSRQPGAGRPTKISLDLELLDALKRLVEPEARGNPMSALLYTAKSVRNLEEELRGQGHVVSYRTVGRLLKAMNYRLNANRKMLEGAEHPDRDEQFKYINSQIAEQQAVGDPATSVDTKKKELVGDFKNAGVEWTPMGQPIRVKDHDFIGDLGRASPYGVFDVIANQGWVSVGISADTGEFAVNTLRSWWRELGQDKYLNCKSILVTADCGGSNGYRLRLWKWELQGLADELGKPITVCHLPPGTSKWNKIEHMLFSAIARNWRAVPLVDYATIVQLIASTHSKTGLKVACRLDDRIYEKGRKVSDVEMASINLRPHKFHGEWNYTISPRSEV